jgi:hypothetical protein
MIKERFWTGGEMYYIDFENGTHCIKRVDGDIDTTVFQGFYEKCLEEKQRLLEENADYDLNL